MLYHRNGRKDATSPAAMLRRTQLPPFAPGFSAYSVKKDNIAGATTTNVAWGRGESGSAHCFHERLLQPYYHDTANQQLESSNWRNVEGRMLIVHQRLQEPLLFADTGHFMFAKRSCAARIIYDDI